MIQLERKKTRLDAIGLLAEPLVAEGLATLMADWSWIDPTGAGTRSCRIFSDPEAMLLYGNTARREYRYRDPALIFIHHSGLGHSRLGADIRVLDRISACFPEAHLAVCIDRKDYHAVQGCLTDRIKAIVPIQTGADALSDMLSDCVRGVVSIPRSVVEHLHSQHPTSATLQGLTEIDYLTIAQILAGYRIPDIARENGISRSGAKRRQGQVMRKLSVNTARDVVGVLLRSGISSVEDLKRVSLCPIGMAVARIPPSSDPDARGVIA